MDDFYDLNDALDFNLFDSDSTSLQESIAEDIFEVESGNASDAYISRSSLYWQQVPFPEEIPLAGTNVLANVDDETLLNLSPTLIAHIQRTEASNGAQIVSPRAMTLGGLAARTNHTHRTTDMFLVGSAASRNEEWPTLDSPVPSHLFYREPIDSYPSDPAARNKTVTAGVLSSTTGIDDPITKAFLVGRALVDLQRRPDVAGSADALSEILAACWKVEPDAYTDMGEASLAPTGPLLRYAIRTDAGYPVVNAPVQARKCMSVGANTAGRHLYGEYAALDWRRLRVLAESVFYQASRLEGYTMIDMVAAEPPGNPRAPPNRPGILQMRPLPGSVWSFDPRSFRLDIVASPAEIPGVEVPQRVQDAVARYHEMARPIAVAAANGARISYAATLNLTVKPEAGETLIAGYRKVLDSSAAFSARGKTAAATVRNFVYQCLAEGNKLSSVRSLWLARNMQETIGAMNYGHLMDLTTSRHMASRMADITTDLRSRLGVEAGRRGSDLDTWWSDICAQLPSEVASLKEGSGSWAIVTAHYLLHPPTDKWRKLVMAMSHRSHENMARAHLTDVRLPAKIGSAERVFEAGASVARSLGTTYGAYYTAMSDTANILSARLKRAGNAMGANKLRLAGLMWDIRAKVSSTVTLHMEDGTSTEGGVHAGAHGVYHITTAPHSAYMRWLTELNQSAVVSRAVKQSYPHHAPAVVSRVFRDQKTPLFNIPVGSGSRLMRYAARPDKLAEDIEKTLGDIMRDVARTIQFYDAEEREVATGPLIAANESLELAKVTVPRPDRDDRSFWGMVAKMDQLDAQEASDALCRMDTAQAAELEAGPYDTPEQALAAIWGAVDAEPASKAKDAVV